MNAAIPSGMVEVTKDEFYKALEADKRDIMPRNNDPYQTTWETKDRVIWGWSRPGWKNPGERKVYAIKREVTR